MPLQNFANANQQFASAFISTFAVCQHELQELNIESETKKFISKKLSKTFLLQFVRPHLDCGDIIYDQPNNESFTHKN